MTDGKIVIFEPLAQLESKVQSNRNIRALDPLDTRINTDFAYSFCSAACCRSSGDSQRMGSQDDEYLVDSGTRLEPLLLRRLTESTCRFQCVIVRCTTKVRLQLPSTIGI